MTRKQRLCVGIVSLSSSCKYGAQADDWPQWRGLNRNGVSAEQGWLARWPADAPPKTAWKANVGKGHSAVSIASGRAYTMGWDGKNDTVFCFDAATGKLLWKQSYSCGDIVQWSGPRATPTVDGDTVYTLGQHGQLHAWHAVTGKKLWVLLCRTTTSRMWTTDSPGRRSYRVICCCWQRARDSR